MDAGAKVPLPFAFEAARARLPDDVQIKRGIPDEGNVHIDDGVTKDILAEGHHT